jgi:hypothetical protein
VRRANSPRQARQRERAEVKRRIKERTPAVQSPSLRTSTRFLATAWLGSLTVLVLATAPAHALPRGASNLTRENVPAVRQIVTANDGTVSVYDLAGSHVTLANAFTVQAAEIAGLTIDPTGRIVVAVRQTVTPGPCNARGPIPTSCLVLYDRGGNVLGTVPPPAGDADATYTGVASDRYGNVYVSDRTFNGIFFYQPSNGSNWASPRFVGQTDAATSLPSAIAVSTRGEHVAGVTVPTRCDGSAQIVLFERRRNDYAAHVVTCHSGHGAFAGRTGNLALADEGAIFAPFHARVDVFTTYAPMMSFELPNPDAIATGIALHGSRLYVADANANAVYVYARAAGGWSAAPPVLVATYTGFAALGSIALR